MTPDHRQLYEYKGHRYALFQYSNMKIGGTWIECIIYETAYQHPEGKYFVREKNEFFELFKPVNQ